MKTKLLLTALFPALLFISRNSFSQVNSYFMNNPVWQIEVIYGEHRPCFQYETYNYYTNGDTTFNSLVYKKIFKKGEGSYRWMGPPPPPFIDCSKPPYNYIQTKPSYFLRSIGKKIFLRQPSDTSEHLLYDFNLKVNDTLPVSYNNHTKYASVTAIDSIYTQYGYRKRFTLKNSNARDLLEGIGNSNGLVETFNTVMDNGWRLTCFSLNDIAYYPKSGPTCNMAVGIRSFKTETFYSIFPNPFSTYTTLQFNSMIQNGELTIYNIHGQKIKTINLISTLEITLNRDNLPSGMYFIRLIQDGKVIVTDKLIITDN